jgi:uncharacterized protein YcaQ
MKGVFTPSNKRIYAHYPLPPAKEIIPRADTRKKVKRSLKSPSVFEVLL